ncbi:AraC family transcriptional regulator [Prevotella sp.]|uniref:AraC family transcriptional regulator n=1 Tax=Prevotella sp. TaxID=59823 RepID=UPI002F93A212
MNSTLYIKNMVCDRCKMAVESVLTKLQIVTLNVELGEVIIGQELSDTLRKTVKEELEALGFELLDDQRQRTITQIKSAIIKIVHYQQSDPTLNLSDYISTELRQEYSSLSKLFSEVTGMTIEKHYIAQRIERVKELIKYDELSLTQIALQMNYSSVAHLSSQFKTITGMTPSAFKAMKANTRMPLDQI